MSLAVKYRPQNINDVCGNQVTIKIIEGIIKAKKVKNLLLSGQSGAGKTTLARIIATSVNGSLAGTIELDCASQNSVDNVRSIIASAYERSLVSEYKIFILDECHMFTTAAWNALLKLLEDCPTYTLLFFCTTDELKIPQTVRNRLQRYTVSKIPVSEIRDRLAFICKQEGFTNYEKACDFIAKLSDGSLREAITSVEKCSDYSTDLSMENVKAVLGDSSYETMFRLTWALTKKQESELFSIIEQIDASGSDLKRFIDLYTSFVLDLTKFIIFKDISLTNIPEYLATEDNAVTQFTVNIDDNLNYFNRLTECLLELKLNIKYDTAIKNTITISLLKFLRR